MKKFDNRLPYDFHIPEYYNAKAFNEVAYGLKELCRKHKYIVILSKICRKIKVNFYDLVNECINRRIRCRMYIFKDKEYLNYVGECYEILVTWQDLLNVLPHLCVDTNSIKKIIKKGTSCFFDIDDYSNFVKQRIIKETKNKLLNDSFFKDISLTPSHYYNKEHVTEHKYASNELERYVVENKKNATHAELIALDVLVKNNVEFEFQKPCVVFGKCYIMDFYLPKFGVCIEIDGEYHNSQEQLIKDKERANNLAKSGVLVVRFTNEEAEGRVAIKQFIDSVLFKQTS